MRTFNSSVLAVLKEHSWGEIPKAEDQTCKKKIGIPKQYIQYKMFRRHASVINLIHEEWETINLIMFPFCSY